MGATGLAGSRRAAELPAELARICEGLREAISELPE
jgi:hypothetical protein